MNKNFGQMLSSLSTWAREPVDPDIGRDALNDGIEAIWSKVLEAQVSQFVGGPATISLASASERTQLVSIPDPVTPSFGAAVAGGALGGRVVYVSYSFVTESGSETKISPVFGPIIVNANNIVQHVSPIFPVGLSSPPIGWNSYMSSSSDTLGLQNAAPLPFGQPFFEPLTGAVEVPDAKGIPLENTTADDIFYIRKLETPLTSGGFKQWDQVTIDSQMFKYASRSIAAASEFQSYYYDLINGRTLEYRPALAMAYPSARYFFIHKPRRISFDTASIPFYTFPWEEALRSYALAAWFMTQNEEAAQSWESKGNTALARSVSILRQQDWDKDLRITPFIAG